jgi:uncharacterized phage protein (TIGR02220 family)
LWAYAAENQPDGNMAGYSSEELAELLGCPIYAKTMLQALKKCGFVDESGLIHDWSEHNRYHEKFSNRAKVAAAARWAKEKTPKPPKENKDSGKRTVDSGVSMGQALLNDATSIYSPESRVAIHWLNEKSGRKFRETESSLLVIAARMKEPGVDIDGVKKMIERQCLRWIGTTQEEYLRPETLFSKTKFDGYYAAKDLPVTEQKNGKPAKKPDYDKGF